MAQNITLLGASYTAVPAVTLPKTGGGTAKFSDASVTTAVASDVAEGKIFLLADGTQATGTASGGGEPTYETYFDDSITVDNGISIASLADLYFAQGETWRVTWDGVEYICNTQIYEGWLWTVGNQSLASTDDGVNEPFLLYNYGGGAMNGNARTGGTHTLKLEKQTSSGGGGSATLITKTITENGTYSAEDDDADGYSSVTVNVPSGASNIVTGTFKGTTTDVAMDVDLAYTGNGYPLNVMIYPKEGAYDANSTIYTLVQRYCTILYVAIKDYVSTAPDYNGTGTDDQYTTINRYKNHSSNYTTYGQNVSVSNPIANGSNALATGSGKYVVAFKAKNKMSVFIANTSYGFPANIEFKYQIVYSS